MSVFMKNLVFLISFYLALYCNKCFHEEEEYKYPLEQNNALCRVMNNIQAEHYFFICRSLFYINISKNIQYNLNGSNPDGTFTLDDSNLFSVPTKSFQ